jgi:putative membrane protein
VECRLAADCRGLDASRKISGMEADQQKGPPEDPRVRLAGERTLLAWIRTGVAMMGFGFVVARFGLFLRELAEARNASIPPSYGLSLWVGSALVFIGVVVTLMSAAEHATFLRRLNRGDPYRAPKWSLGIVVAIFMAVLGIGMLAYLLLVSR